MQDLTIVIGVEYNGLSVALYSNNTLYLRLREKNIVFNRYFRAYQNNESETKVHYIPINELILAILEHESIHHYLENTFGFKVSARFDRTQFVQDELKKLFNLKLDALIDAQLN